MKKLFYILLIFSMTPVLANQVLINKRIIMRQIDMARTIEEVDKIVEKAKRLESNYLSDYSSEAELRKKLRHTKSWLPDIIISSEFKRRKLMLKRKKHLGILQLLSEVFDTNNSVEARELAADAILKKKAELSAEQAKELVKKLCNDSEPNMRMWIYANMSSLVDVRQFLSEIKKGLQDPCPGVVCNTVNIIPDNNLQSLYHHLFHTVKINSDETMGNSAIALIKIGVLGSSSIPFLASTILSDNSIRISYARPALTSIFMSSINSLFVGSTGLPLHLALP